MGGTNQDLAGPSRQELILGQNQPLFSKPIMFVGADVTHPAPDQMGVKPSIAAIVASIDPAVSRYICEVNTSTQGPLITTRLQMGGIETKLFFPKHH